MSDDDLGEYASKALLDHGYEEVSEYRGTHRSITKGGRVYVLSRPYRPGGNADVLFIGWKRNSLWSLNYGADDVEVVVRLDDDGTVRTLASYHVNGVES